MSEEGSEVGLLSLWRDQQKGQGYKESGGTGEDGRGRGREPEQASSHTCQECNHQRSPQNLHLQGRQSGGLRDCQSIASEGSSHLEPHPLGLGL